MALPSPVINVMSKAARKAARGLLRDFGEVEHLQVSKKGPADFVSTADTRTERLLREELGQARPDFGFLMEESGASAGKDGAPRWVVDPLDGTLNFLHGLPHFAIALAVQDGREITAGVIYDPLKDELFWAERGRGAYLNDRRIRVSARQHMADSVIATGIPFLGREGHKQFLATQEAVMRQVAGIRRWGVASLDLAYVAAGRFDGFWEFGLQPWDIAAGLILVREAGGFATEIDGGDGVLASGNILATNDALYRPISRLLQDALKLDLTAAS